MRKLRSAIPVRGVPRSVPADTVAGDRNPHNDQNRDPTYLGGCDEECAVISFNDSV